jgi:hypothetical protein
LREALEVLGPPGETARIERAYVEHNLAWVLCDRGEHEAGLSLVVAARDRMGADLAPDHWWIAHADSIQGACLTGLGRYVEAEPLLLESLARLESLPTYAALARRRIATLYERWGKPHLAEPWSASTVV